MSHATKLFNTIIGRKFMRHNYLTFKHVCNYSKDSTKSIIQTTTSIPPDFLFQDLKNATSSESVLDMVGDHYKIMNSKQLLQALRSLFTLQKYGNSSISTNQIIKHPDFEKLCRSLKSQAGMIELNETLEALKIISYVGVSSNSTIVQVLLQLLRHNINDLSLQHIIFLDFLLRQFKSSPLVDGLLIALPVVFEANLPVKLDRDNAAHLAECLQYASKKNVSPKCIELLVNSLNKAIDFHGGLHAKIANSILWSICDMEPNEFFVPLFKKALNGLLTDGLDKLNYQDVITTLSKISYKTSAKFTHYYDNTYYDACAEYIIDKDLGIEEAIYTLFRFTSIGHTSDNLLNYLSKKCQDNPEVIIKGPPLHVFVAALAAAQSEYRPNNWEIMKDVIESTKFVEHYDKRDIIWMKFAASLCALDIYKTDVLEKALDISFLNHILRHGTLADFDNFLLIQQAINVFKPHLKYVLPEHSLIQALSTKVKPVVEYPLEGALQKALGGENYVNTCMKTKLYHHIDHVIIMRKGGFPVPLAKNRLYIEELEGPTDGFMILVLALNHWHYTINTKRLKATSLLKIKTLEANGYNVVPICMEVWERLLDFERIPFIMQAIKLKIETKIEMSNAVC